MEVIEGIPCFFDGVNTYQKTGAVQVMAANLAGNPNKDLTSQAPYLTGKDLGERFKIFLQKQNVSDAPAQYFTRDNTEMAACEYHKDGHFYLALMAERKKIFVLALYNCKGEPPAEEAHAVGKILQSLTLI